MFVVIYRGFLKAGTEDQYRQYWKTVATYFVKERGSLGSTLHKTDDGMWVAYSKWPNKATRDASWPSNQAEMNQEIPSFIQEAIKGLKFCLDKEKYLPEICMEVIEEVFNKE